MEPSEADIITLIEFGFFFSLAKKLQKRIGNSKFSKTKIKFVMLVFVCGIDDTQYDTHTHTIKQEFHRKHP